MPQYFCGHFCKVFVKKNFLVFLLEQEIFLVLLVKINILQNQGHTVWQEGFPSLARFQPQPTNATVFLVKKMYNQMLHNFHTFCCVDCNTRSTYAKLFLRRISTSSLQRVHGYSIAECKQHLMVILFTKRGLSTDNIVNTDADNIIIYKEDTLSILIILLMPIILIILLTKWGLLILIRIV